MYKRITRTVSDRGELVRPEDVLDKVTDSNIDWYQSAYTYGEDAKEYWDENNQSIKGYDGEAWTDTLYWDLDCKEDFKVVSDAALSLVEVLNEYAPIEAIELYFSGYKGIHVLLRTNTKFTPKETSVICYNIAKKAGLDSKVFDTSVYNVTRIFRINGTKHQASGLYKVPISEDELADDDIDIFELAKEPRGEYHDVTSIDAEFLKTEFIAIQEPTNVVDLRLVKEESSEVDYTDCPPDYRKCIYALEQGCFGPGQRENAIIRLAAYYKVGMTLTKDMAFDKITQALEKRSTKYSDLNPYNDEDTNRCLDQVYSDGWKDGMYTCKTDWFLQELCDKGDGPCAYHQKNYRKNVMTIRDLFKSYTEYGDEALEEYPKTGLKWIDDRVRFRPRNFSVINASNGAGKTSLAMQMMEEFNKQKLHNIFFSLDMANTSLFEKLGAKYTNYTANEIEAAFNKFTRDEGIMQEVYEAIQAKLPYTLFDFSANASLKYIEQTMKDIEDNNENINIQVAVVDYAGRMPGDHDNGYANATANALAANDVCKRTNSHFVFLSQISREKGDHTDSIRSSRVSKDSGAWEEAATIIMNLWRPFGNGIEGDDSYMNIYIAKNRSGKLGENVFHWDGKTGSISELSGREFMEYERMCEQHNIAICVTRDAPAKETKKKEDNGKKLPTGRFGRKVNRAT